MTNAPYLLLKARGGYRMGHGEVLDHMFYDGLQSPWDGQLMGCFAEKPRADKYGFTRADQDAFAAESVRRAQRAVRDGDFAAEITPVTVKGRKGETVVAQDETPFTCDLAKIPTLKPAFRKDGTVTAASSSSISDGAAAVVLAWRGRREGARPRAARAHRRLREPRAGAGVVHHGARGCDPEGCSSSAGWKAATSTCTRSTRRSPWSRWPRCATSASTCAQAQRQRRRLRARPPDRRHRRAHRHHAGARAAQRGLRRGIASLCIGGGEATAICIELLA